MSSSSQYHLPAIAAMAGLALAASGYALSSTNGDARRRRRRIKTKILKERDGRYVTGLVNTGNSCFVNSALATLASLRSYLAERVDERGDDLDNPLPPTDPFILSSVAYALYTTIETLNRPLARPAAITPVEVIRALERKTQSTIKRDQQDAQELFQIISHALSSEEELQYREQAPSLLDVGTLKKAALDHLETASMSSVGTMGSMWSSFSVSTTGGHLRHRPRRPRNPFTGLAATKISCMKCGYTAPIRHNTFDNISLTVPQQVNPYYIQRFALSCTLQSCLDTYTKVDVLTDFRCRKCMLTTTLEHLQRELSQAKPEQDIEELQGKIQIIKDAIKYNVEAPLPGIELISPPTFGCTTKQTMFANPPKSLCFHLSRSVYHPSGFVQKNHCQVRFPEYLDIASYTTNGYLNTTDPSASMSTPATSNTVPQSRMSRTSLVYLRNMAAGHRFVHGQRDGLNVALKEESGQSDHPVQNALPSWTLPVNRAVPYRLSAVVVHYGSHESGHFITFRRKKFPTGHDVRRPFSDEADYPEPPSKFWQCSDDSIEEVDIDTVLASEAYMLFYERDV
ncbi:hypothetical protein BCR43DRAFT_444030 [Syncephalastrum racemosum]|uniref:ubiquitinyl hydrolase 1 n=1 Tax=Syncephalastrum racemosum TaxID=13706 RepID=A0A1X2H6W7_SYNRA|nr:hypothetical protein BCR43DRAFT_444030 [Syncephalastrum racemosum]